MEQPPDAAPRTGVLGISPERMAAGGLAPVLVFYAALRLWGLGPAVVLGLTAAGAVFLYRLVRDRRLDPVSAGSFAVTAVLGALAHYSGTPNLFLAEPAVSNVAIGAALLASVALRRPLVGLAVASLYPPAAAYARSPHGTFAFGVVTAAWGITNLARGGVRLYLLKELETGQFLLANILLGWPVTGPLAVGSFLYLRWHARRTRHRSA